MKNAFVVAAAILVLGACGEAANPPTQAAGPVTEVPTNPIAPIPPGKGPDSFVGTWAADKAWCSNTSATTDQVPIRISAERIEGHENRCNITALQQTGDSYKASLVCEGEGLTSQETVNMRVVGDRLTMTYADRSGEPVDLVRCRTESGAGVEER